MTGRQFGPVHVVLGRPSDDPEQWQVVSNEPTSVETFGEYGERFQIEKGFLDEKSGLFELEASKLRDANSLERLVMVISVATLLLVSEALDVVERGDRRRVDPHWQRGLSYLKIGHKAMSYTLSRGQRFFKTLRLRGGPDPEPPKPRKCGQPSSLEALKNGWHVSFHFIS